MFLEFLGLRYYGYLKWQPSKGTERRNFIKKKVLEYWLKYPMYGYPGLTKLFNEVLKYPVSAYLIYRLVGELDI